MTINVKIGDIEKMIEKKIKKAVDASIDQDLADSIADQVRVRTQLGFGVDDNGNQFKFAPLSESYRAQRRGDIAFFTNSNGVVIPFNPDSPPILSRYTTPAKSNVTKTGQLLESLTGEAKGNQILVDVKGLRKDGSGLTNEEVLEFLEGQGKTFLALSNSEKKALVREIKNRILRNL